MAIKRVKKTMLVITFAVVLCLLCGCVGEKSDKTMSSDVSKSQESIFLESSSITSRDRSTELIREYNTELVFRDRNDDEAYLIIIGDRIIKEFNMYGSAQKMSIKRINIEEVDEARRNGGAVLRIYDVTGQFIEFNASEEDAKAIRRGMGR